MRTPVKLGAFGLGLAAVFTAALGVGRVVGPAPAPAATHNQHADAGGHQTAADTGGHQTAADAGGHQTAADTGSHQAAAGTPPAGLQVSQDGYRLLPVTTVLSTGDPRPFTFRILGPGNAPVTAYTTSHDKDLHLIVVRRDLAGFQHVHPTLGADGTWSIPLAVPAPGQYRVFADFQPAGRADGLTLGVDVPAPGDYRPRPLPPPSRASTVDGYQVTLAGDLIPGTSSRLTVSVRKDGRPVTDLQPYLGAYGHLVALRDGDLAYLHVHPDGTPGDGRTQAGPEVTFHAEVPSAGGYRLYLDFQHAGAVRTAEFTAVAGPHAPTDTPPAAAPRPPASSHGADGHTHQ